MEFSGQNLESTAMGSFDEKSKAHRVAQRTRDKDGAALGGILAKFFKYSCSLRADTSPSPSLRMTGFKEQISIYNRC
jgi:hypothetical protein